MRRKISLTDGQTDRGKTVYPPPPSGSGGIINLFSPWYVGLYTHWTYMHIFCHIFLSNYWWQRSDIWSQASYRYPISWEAFLNPSDSYFLFADLCVFGKQKVGIWWVQKRFPQYGVPIWSLWPNIRSLPSIVAEKIVTKNVHIQMYVQCV
jgi:hypothetical protein